MSASHPSRVGIGTVLDFIASRFGFANLIAIYAARLNGGAIIFMNRFLAKQSKYPTHTHRATTHKNGSRFSTRWSALRDISSIDRTAYWFSDATCSATASSLRSVNIADAAMDTCKPRRTYTFIGRNFPHPIGTLNATDVERNGNAKAERAFNFPSFIRFYRATQLC